MHPRKRTIRADHLFRTDDAITYNGPVPQAVKAGGWIYVSAVFRRDSDAHMSPTPKMTQAAEAGVRFDNLTTLPAADGDTLN